MIKPSGATITDKNSNRKFNKKNKENQTEGNSKFQFASDTNHLNAELNGNGVPKKSRARNNNGSGLGGILASLSLVTPNKEKSNIEINTSQKTSRSNRHIVERKASHNVQHDRKNVHQKEKNLLPLLLNNIQEPKKEASEIAGNTLESVSTMMLFPNDNSTKSESSDQHDIPKIQCYPSSMTPSPFRNDKCSLPSVVQIGSFLDHPSPLGQSPSPRPFGRLRKKIKSPPAIYNFTSPGLSKISNGIKEEETEEDTSLEISIYRPKPKKSKGKKMCGNNNAIEAYSDEEYNPESSESDKDENLSFFISSDDSKFTNEEQSHTKDSTSRMCVTSSDGNFSFDSYTEIEEDYASSSGNKMKRNDMPSAESVIISIDSGGEKDDSNLVEALVIDDTFTAEDTNQDESILTIVHGDNNEIDYASDIDNQQIEEDDVVSLKEGRCEELENEAFNSISVMDSFVDKTERRRENFDFLSGTLDSNMRNKVKKGKWTLGAQIGLGSFGVVHVGMNSCTGKFMAVKSLNIPSSSSNKVMVDLKREIDLMQSLKHPNIVKFIGAEIVEHVLHIFQEWVPGGSVSSLLRNFGPFPLPVVRSYLFQIFAGLEYLHSKLILHRDIKGGNVLVNDEGVVKLADFGASKRIELSKNGLGTEMEDMMETMTMRGTPYFMAPEVFEECRYGSKADMWSCGGVAYQMYTGKTPWKDLGLKTPMSLFTYLKKHDGPPLCDKNENCPTPSSNAFKDILKLCFNRDPIERPTAHESLQHSFFTLIDPDESFIDEGSITGSTGSCANRSPISPISPSLLQEMKNNMTNEKIAMGRKKKDGKNMFDSEYWPIWAKEAMIRRKERIQTGANPFVQT